MFSASEGASFIFSGKDAGLGGTLSSIGSNPVTDYNHTVFYKLGLWIKLSFLHTFLGVVTVPFADGWPGTGTGSGVQII